MFLEDLAILADIVGDIVTLPVKVAHWSVELGNDITETVAQDIQNRIEGIPEQEARTSYTVRDEAEEIVAKSNARYHDALGGMNRDWNAMLQERQEVGAKREEVYRMIGKAVSSEALTELPSSRDLMPKTPSCPSMDSFGFNVGTYMGLSAAQMRMEIAEEYYQKAKQFRAEMDQCIGEIHQVQYRVKAVRDAQEEEMVMLRIIQTTYQNQSASVLAESNTLLYQIAELGLQEVSDQTAKRYQELVQTLKRLWL